MTPTADRKAATILLNDEPARTVFREQHRVKLIAIADEGSSIHNVPDGTYGFTYSPTAAAPVFSTRKYQNFEIHKAVLGDKFILGYVTAAELADIQKKNAIDVKLYPDSYEQSTELVCLALDDVHPRTQNSGQPGSPAPLRYEP